jgi:hypothetical protein
MPVTDNSIFELDENVTRKPVPYDKVDLILFVTGEHAHSSDAAGELVGSKA